MGRGPVYENLCNNRKSVLARIACFIAYPGLRSRAAPMATLRRPHLKGGPGKTVNEDSGARGSAGIKYVI